MTNTEKFDFQEFDFQSRHWDLPFLRVIVREPSMGLNRPLHVASPLCATRYISAEPSGTGPPGKATSWSMVPIPMAALFRLPCTVWPAFS